MLNRFKKNLTHLWKTGVYILKISLRYASAIFSKTKKVGFYLLNGKQKILMIALCGFFVFNLFLFSSIAGQFVSYSQTTVESNGLIKTLGVSAYQDPECLMPLSNLDWGKISPASSIRKTIYIRNEGNSDLTLSQKNDNWNPTIASTYISLTWNYVGQIIKENQIEPIELTLRVSRNVDGIDSFNFDITIQGN